MLMVDVVALILSQTNADISHLSVLNIYQVLFGMGEDKSDMVGVTLTEREVLITT